MYRWLQHTDPSSIHFRARKDYEPETGTWILRAPEWSSWLNANERCLWIHGIPGAGKTVLMSYLIEQIKQHCSNSHTTKCASVYYYCYFGRNQNEAAPFLRWLISQLCRQADLVPRSVYELYRHGAELNLEELLAAVGTVLGEFDHAYLAVDALDESIPRDDLLQILRTLASDPRFKKIQLLVSSREYIDIEKVMEEFSVPVSMANPYVEEDIRLHVRSTLKADSKFKHWPQVLLDKVEETLSVDARGMYVAALILNNEHSIVDTRNRFRWAVCQIDVLRRLKCEQTNVEKALKNLPKTLDETYDLILLAIPHDDLVVVSHILQWISYHNGLYRGEGIPCEILIQAVTESTKELTIDGLERFYDNDTLRELCGCLIKIGPEVRAQQFASVKYTTLAVSFAHYTVREYLDSRCSTNAVVSFTVCQEDLRQHILGIVFSEAHQIDIKLPWTVKIAPVTYLDAINALSESLSDYCVVSALLSLHKLPAEICQHERLSSMAIDLFYPSKPHWENLVSAASRIETLTDLLRDTVYCNNVPFVNGEFWRLNWQGKANDMVTVHFLHLLLLAEATEECLLLAEKFLQAKDTRDFLQARMRFEKEVVSFIPFLKRKSYIFDGSIIEIYAQMAMSSQSTFRLLLDHGAGLFDPSKILLLYIGRRWQDRKVECQRDCILRRLLDIGADPNAKGSKITPLQIAVVSKDVVGIEILLSAGADPNDTGTSGGTVWEDRTFMSRFNHLDGASALYICRRLDPDPIHFRIALGRVRRANEENRKKIEAILLQHGAKEFKRIGDQRHFFD